MNNKNSKMLGIILVPLVFGILILVASAFAKDRGYVKANDFPQALQNLVASGLLTAEETTDEDGYEEETGGYRSGYECLLDSEAFMERRTGSVVSIVDSETDYAFGIKYDSKKKALRRIRMRQSPK